MAKKLFKVYLLLGSNMGDREQIVNDAVTELIDALLPDYLEVESLDDAVNTSALYETEPWGFESDNKFINQAFTCITELEPQQVLAECLRIEKELGRVRTGSQFDKDGNRIYTSRPIDIDILLMYEKTLSGNKGNRKESWNLCTINEENLVVPHPRMKEREFAKKPMREFIKQAPDNFSNFVK